MFIDEIDASLDASGVESVFKLLKDKTRDEGLGLWIISHRPEAVGRFDRAVTIRKQNGFSKIIMDGEAEE
jgi:DNA repair exonuclease SbcCD ATPase subunit